MPNITEILKTELAVKMIENLSEEDRRQILAQGVENELFKLNLNYDIAKVLKEEALVFVGEYIKQPEIQETLKNKAHEAVDNIFDGIVRVIGESIEDTIKNKYVRILSKPKYGEG